MMGHRRFAPRLYYQLSLDRLVPSGHLLRHIAEVIDFSFVYPLARPYYSHTGQPSVDPIVLFKALLVGYLYGITSERRLMDEIQVNLAYRWFLGYDLDEATPNHSVLSKARARFGPEVFEEFFRQSIELCRKAGLLSEGPVYVDSTLVQAAASMDSLARRDELAQPPLSVREYVRRLYQENDSGAKDEAPTDSEPTPPPPEPPPPRGVGRPRRPNEEQRSRTDPEATLVNRPQFGCHLAYKAHLAVAGRRGQVITAAVATTGAAADEHLLAEVLWQHHRLSGLGIPAAVADAKYGTTFNLLYLGRLGIPAFIPLTRFGNMRKDIWGREHFQWLPEKDAYLCPADQPLRRYSNMKSTQRVRYRAPRGSCAACPFRSQCSPSGRERAIHRSWGQEFVDATEQLLASPLGRQRLVERKIYIEGAFALAKELHGLRRTRFKGRQRVQIQLWLTAAAMNIKKAVRELAGMAPVAIAARAARPGTLLSSLYSIAGRLPLPLWLQEPLRQQSLPMVSGLGRDLRATPPDRPGSPAATASQGSCSWP
jgi:transposase